jgi:hypothetical protein
MIRVKLEEIHEVHTMINFKKLSTSIGIIIKDCFKQQHKQDKTTVLILLFNQSLRHSAPEHRL